MTNALTLVKAGLGNSLCVEGAWTIRENPALSSSLFRPFGWLGTSSCERKTVCFHALRKVSGPMPRTTGDPKSQTRSSRRRFRTAKIIKEFRLATPPLK